MPGTLHLVATPIGNLEDITLRALRVLREVDLIAAEDTRRTAKLLTHHGISRPTLSFHEHNSRGRTPQLVARLASGESIALVTDAGTPGVSDPGAELVQACIEAGIPVNPVPGVSAPLAAVVASGFPVTPLTIFGFAPSRSNDRTAFIRMISESKSTVTFFESPHRIVATLTEAHVILGKRPIMVGRELTKIHQEFIRGTVSEVLARLGEPKGEFTIVVGPFVAPAQRSYDLSDAEIAAEFERESAVGTVSRRTSVAAVARRLGRTTRDVYSAVERAKKSVE